jgi:hypothetical protein
MKLQNYTGENIMITKVIAIKDMSVGNAETGEAWQETKIFDKGEPILEIIKWAFPDVEQDGYSRKRVTITIPKE